MNFEAVGAAIRKHFGDPVPLESLPPAVARRERERRRWVEAVEWFGADYEPGYSHPFMSMTGMEGRCMVCELADSQLHSAGGYYARLTPGGDMQPLPIGWDRQAALAAHAAPIEE